MKYPNFLIIGTMKGGTESAVFHLNQHPDVYLYAEEIHYFDYPENYKIKEKNYLNKFKKTKCKMRGEKTPSYMLSAEVLKRIHDFNKDMKLIMFLREPIQRTISHYKHELRAREKNNKEIVDFDTFINSYQGPRNPVIRGFYDQQLENIYQIFPKENVLVLISEEVLLNPQKEYAKIFKFLNVSDYKIKYKANVHKASNNLKIEENKLKELYELFKDHNENLLQILEREIPSWIDFYSSHSLIEPPKNLYKRSL